MSNSSRGPLPVVIPTPRGVPLAGLLYGAAGEATAAVVFCHGFLGTQDTMAPRFAELVTAAEPRLAMLTFDYSGFGDSAGPNNRVDPFAQVEDVAAAVRAVAGLVPGAHGVGLLGISFGSGVALQAAALDRSVAAVLSLSTYRTGEEWLGDMRPLHEMASLLATVDAARRTGTAGHEVMIPVTRVFPRDPIGASYEQNMRDEGSKRARELDATSVEQIVRFRPIDHACALRVKASHFVHCNDDVTMAVAHARDFADRAHGSIEVLPGVDHYQVYQPQHLEPLCDRIAAFFGRTLGVGQ